MSTYIENIFSKLLTPDSITIKQNKIYSATLLRKKVKNWKTLRDCEKSQIKTELINTLVNEADEGVRKQIILLIATTYKYSLKSNQEWPEVLTFINGLVVSSIQEQHLSGVFMLSILNEEAAEQLKPHYLNILQIFSKILADLNNLKSAFYVISCLKSIIPYSNEVELNDLMRLLPQAVNASIKIIKADQEEETLRAIFDFFQSIIEYDLDISSYIKHLGEMVIEFITDKSLKNPTRVCAMNFLNVLIETQKAYLLKNDMIQPIVNSIFMTMCESSDPLQTKSDLEVQMLDDDNDENPDEIFVDDVENLFTAATQVLDYCALYFPAKKFIQTLIEYIIPAIQSTRDLDRRAALAALAITSEGCADFYRNHYLELLTGSFLKGMQDSSSMVVQMSYFALCQFSEYLQPNMAQFREKIMHILFESMEAKVELRSVSRLTIRFYDALQSYCENLGEDLVHFLPTLMSKLLTLEVQCNSSLKLQRLIISTFSSIVWSVKSKFSPYFEFAVQIIKPYLSYDQLSIKQHDIKLIQIESIELMGVFAKFIGKEKFTDAYINNCLTFVQNVLGSESDPEMKSAAYNLLAGLTSRLKENLPLKEIMPKIIESLKSEEGINIIDSDENKNDIFSAFDEVDLQEEDIDDDEDDDEDEEDENLGGDFKEDNQVVIENEFVAQKLAALNCLQEIIKYSNPQFIDFHDQCIEELKSLTSFLHHNIKKESFLAFANLISYFHDFFMSYMGKINDAQKEAMLKTLNSNMNDFYLICVKATKKEPSRQIIMSIYESIKILLARCAPYIKNNLNEFSKSLETYANMITETFENKAFCQIVDQIVDSVSNVDTEENQAEYDYMLKEYAGDIVPSLALCLPENMFDVFFEKCLIFLLNTLNKSEATVSEMSFVIGVIGETISNLENLKASRAQQLFTEIYKHIYSTEDEIRSNTIFTIGVLCSQSRNTLQEYYSKITTDLLEILKTEKHKQTLDNICGTLCRLFMCGISSNSQTINYELIIKAIFDLTPLKVDFNEYFTLYSFILQIATNKLLTNFYPKIVEFSGQILLHHQDETKKGTRELLVQFLKYINENYKQELDTLLGQINKEAAHEITLCLN